MKKSWWLLLLPGGLILLALWWFFSRGQSSSTVTPGTPAVLGSGGGISIPAGSVSSTGTSSSFLGNAAAASGLAGVLGKAISAIGNLFSGNNNTVTQSQLNALPSSSIISPENPANTASPLGQYGDLSALFAGTSTAFSTDPLSTAEDDISNINLAPSFSPTSGIDTSLLNPSLNDFSLNDSGNDFVPPDYSNINLGGDFSGTGDFGGDSGGGDF